VLAKVANLQRGTGSQGWQTYWVGAGDAGGEWRFSKGIRDGSPLSYKGASSDIWRAKEGGESRGGKLRRTLRRLRPGSGPGTQVFGSKPLGWVSEHAVAAGGAGWMGGGGLVPSQRERAGGYGGPNKRGEADEAERSGAEGDGRFRKPEGGAVGARPGRAPRAAGGRTLGGSD
jgi:hypothetical protein